MLWMAILFTLGLTSSRDGDSVIRMIEGLQADLKDVTFLYEGHVRIIGPERLIGERPKNLDSQFQGVYTLRRDGAMLLDLYHKQPGSDYPLIRTQTAYLRGIAQVIFVIPDEQPHKPKPDENPSSPAALNEPESAHRFVLSPWYFRWLADEKTAKVEEVGTEVVDGHRCLVLNVFYDPKDRVNGIRNIVWVDIARGGNILKWELFSGQTLRMRIYDIALKAFPTDDGNSVWVPIHGVTDSFMWGRDLHAEPIYRETYTVVRDTVRVNRGLGDDFFTLTKDVAQVDPKRAIPLRDEYRRIPQKPPQRHDAESIRAALDEELAKADAQAGMIESTTPSQGWITWTGAGQIASFVVAIILIGYVIVLKRSR